MHTRSSLSASTLSRAALVMGVVVAGKTASAQIAYTEGPDLSGQTIGTFAVGDNTITGSLAASLSGFTVSGDSTDQFSFTIPAGMSATALSITLSNLNGSSSIIINPGVQISGGPGGNGYAYSANTPGLNTLTIPSPGYLVPGTYTFTIFTGLSGADAPFSTRSFNYVLRIHADADTGACCNRWTGSCAVMTPAACASVGLRYDGVRTTCSPATCKACPADFDGSGGLAIADIFAMLNAWFAGCP